MLQFVTIIAKMFLKLDLTLVSWTLEKSDMQKHFSLLGIFQKNWAHSRGMLPQVHVQKSMPKMLPHSLDEIIEMPR